jgi:hypothetical protein
MVNFSLKVRGEKMRQRRLTEIMRGNTGRIAHFIILAGYWRPTKGRERNPPPCSRHLCQVVYGCVTLWRQICPNPPPAPTKLAIAVK